MSRDTFIVYSTWYILSLIPSSVARRGACRRCALCVSHPLFLSAGICLIVFSKFQGPFPVFLLLLFLLFLLKCDTVWCVACKISPIESRSTAVPLGLSGSERSAPCQQHPEKKKKKNAHRHRHRTALHRIVIFEHNEIGTEPHRSILNKRDSVKGLQ